MKSAYLVKAKESLATAIKDNKREMQKLQEEIQTFHESRRSLAEAKWNLFRGIILDQILHICANKTYISPKRELLDRLTADLLKFMTTPEFKHHRKKWEFTQESIYRAVSYFYYLAKDFDRSLDLIHKALCKSPHNYFNENLIQIKANILRKKGRYKEAIEFQKVFLKRAPNMHEVRLSFADLYCEQNFYDQAFAEIKTLMKRKHKLTEKDYFRIASIYLKCSQNERACEVLEKALKERPKSLFLLSLYIRLIYDDPGLTAKYQSKMPELKKQYLTLEQEFLKDLGKFPLRYR